MDEAAGRLWWVKEFGVEPSKRAVDLDKQKVVDGLERSIRMCAEVVNGDWWSEGLIASRLYKQMWEIMNFWKGLDREYGWGLKFPKQPADVREYGVWQFDKEFGERFPGLFEWTEERVAEVRKIWGEWTAWVVKNEEKLTRKDRREVNRVANLLGREVWLMGRFSTSFRTRNPVDERVQELKKERRKNALS